MTKCESLTKPLAPMGTASFFFSVNFGFAQATEKKKI